MSKKQHYTFKSVKMPSSFEVMVVLVSDKKYLRVFEKQIKALSKLRFFLLSRKQLCRDYS